MKNLQITLLILCSFIIGFAPSCTDDDDDESNIITITFVSPTDSSTVAAADVAAAPIEITFAAETSLYEVSAEMLDASGNSIWTTTDTTATGLSFTLSKAVDLSAQSGNAITLKASACNDDDCTESTTAEITFNVE